MNILDHGYLKLVESWGSDQHIIEAARMSTDKGFKQWSAYSECQNCGTWADSNRIASAYTCECGKPDWKKFPNGDMGLLTYLYSHKHATPFEMAGMVIEVQAPIMVFREWHRHRTQSYNEMSARYIPLPDVNYVPTIERLMMSSKTNKQAGAVKGVEQLTERNAELFRLRLRDEYAEQQSMYERSLEEGVPKELARLVLPVGRYSRMRASANLRNWLAFLTLRMASEAQWEIRQYANEVGSLVSQLFPRTWGLFNAGNPT